jgi:hypothetical protein
VTLESVRFEGHECVRLGDESVSVLVSTSVGPRILGLSGREGNVLAVLPPDQGLERPVGGRFRFFGGHRLWAAPEVPRVTYQPDDRPCAAIEVEGGVRVEAPSDGAGLAKAIEVRREDDGWVIDHTIRNGSEAPMTIAPWAITQMRLGGEVWLPTGSDGPEPQADRSLVLWPYTDLADPRFRLEMEAVRIDAVAGGPARKIGVAPSEGRVSYRLGEQVFEKRVEVEPRAPYADRGAVVQVYLCDDFCELETLGPLRLVEPGGEISHRERWTLVHDVRGLTRSAARRRQS